MKKNFYISSINLVIISSLLITPLNLVLAAGLSAPFLVQAPTGRWSDIRQEDGCEEATTIMAAAWSRGQKLPTGKLAENLIVDMSNWEQLRYKNFHDTSIVDTAERLLKVYQAFNNYKVIKAVTLNQLKTELQQGRVIIAAMDGKALFNPHFTNGGPIEHMVLIIGYDAKTHEFITNDPGTIFGKGYRYREDLFYKAMRDYPTGNHLKMVNLGKNVIVVSKN